MAYEIGIAENTFDLYHKLRTFMTTIEGWQMWSNIDGYDGYDIVYYSQGSNGTNDIFIRHRARLTEQFLFGLDQFDYTGQGDTGYINFFTYGNFPQDADAYSGVSELGSYGPRLYHFTDNGDSNNTIIQHILSQNRGGTSAGSSDVGSSDYRSLQSFVRGRWSQPNDTLLSEFAFTPDEQACFDGKRYFYYAYNVSNRIFRYTMERQHGGNSGYGYTFGSTGNEVYGDVVVPTQTRPHTGMAVVEHRDTRQQYLYAATDATNGGGGFRRIRLDDNSFTVDSSISDPVWPLRSYSTFFGSSTDSTANNGHMVWDGGDHIYFIRGGFGGLNSLQTPDWGMYTISTNTWINTSSPNNPSFPVFPTDIGTFVTTWFLFVNKIISGFTYNRLYVILGTGTSADLYYIDLHSDTGMPIQTTWQPQTITRQMGSNVFGGGNRYAITRTQKFIVFSSQVGGRTTPDDIFAVWPDAGLYFTDLKESGSIQFDTSDITAVPEGGGTSSHYFIADGYTARVRTSLSDDTNYIFVGDSDRIIVATKSDNKWSMCYMGAFDSTFGTEPYAEVAEDVSAGVSVRIPLRNIRGAFTANQNYTIVGVTQNPAPVTHQYYGLARRFMPAEGITVTNVGEDCVYASIRYDYKAGDKIGIDPQPSGIWLSDLYDFVATNIFPIHYDAIGASTDPSLQTYTTFVEGLLVDEGIPSNRELHYVAWPVPISSTYSPNGSYKGSEDRGRLIGVYALPVSTTLQVGDTIYINDGGYYIVQVENTTTKYAIGPLR